MVFLVSVKCPKADVVLEVEAQDEQAAREEAYAHAYGQDKTEIEDWSQCVNQYTSVLKPTRIHREVAQQEKWQVRSWDEVQDNQTLVPFEVEITHHESDSDWTLAQRIEEQIDERCGTTNVVIKEVKRVGFIVIVSDLGGGRAAVLIADKVGA